MKLSAEASVPSSPSLQRYFSSSSSQYSSRLSSLSEMTNPVVVKKCLLKTLVQRILESLISFHKRVGKTNRFFLTTLWYSSIATLFCKSFYTFCSLFIPIHKSYQLKYVPTYLVTLYMQDLTLMDPFFFAPKNIF